jgi:ADP-ribose pyrophosphatase
MTFTLTPHDEPPKFLKISKFKLTEKHPVTGEPVISAKECLLRGDSVSVIIHAPATNQFVWVEQLRVGPALKEPDAPTTVEPVAGMVDPGESPDDAARRETGEEALLDVEKLQHLFTFFMCAGVSNERMHMYYAAVRDLPTSAIGGLAAENEFLKIHVWTPDESRRAFREGRFKTAQSLLAWQWIQLNLL